MRRSRVVDARTFRFLIVGVINTGVGLGLILAAKWWGGFGDVSANLLGYGAGLIVSFHLNKVWTFRFSGRRGAALVRFLSVAAMAYAANLATVLLLVHGLRIDSYLAQVLGVIPYSLVFYLGSRYYAFASNHV